jgi:nicotinate-nucleotide pyrophosphorylase (carboxylating)
MSELSEDTRRRIAEALSEDLGRGDWTTDWCVDAKARARAQIVAKAEGVVSGLAAAEEVFRLTGDAGFRAQLEEGDQVSCGSVVALVSGAARSILTGERTALNFLAHLSGVATLTRRFATRVAGTSARITDTRKTTPLWRELERAATRAGGAVNHRDGLDAMVLVKENHIAAAGGISRAVERVRAENHEGLAVEVETTCLDEVLEALAAGVDRIMLDNMSLEMVKAAVALIVARAPRPEIEASGGVDIETVQELAAAGVDFISVGALTHSAPALDLSLRLEGAEI